MSTRQDAWRKATELAGGQDAHSSLKHKLIDQAELAVLRRLAVEKLLGGEASYYDLVIKEMES